MKSPKCRLCGENHWGNCVFIAPIPALNAIQEDIQRSSRKRVHNPTEKVKQIPKSVHNAEIKDEECTQYQAKVREVGIREFRGNMAAELKSLPFKIIKNGKVIAVVSSDS